MRNQNANSGMYTSRENPTSWSQEAALSAMIEPNYIKKIRNRIFFIFSFIDTLQIDYYTMHSIVSCWRIIQLIGPSLAVNYSNFWKPNSQYQDVVSIISTLFHLVPIENRAQASIYIELLYFFILLFLFIFLVFYAFYFRRSAKIASYVPVILIIIINGFLHVMHPIMLQAVGESIGRLIMKSCYYNTTLEIVSICLALLIFIGHYFIFAFITSISLTFRPYSLTTVISRAQIIFSIQVWAITFVTALASQLPKIPRAVLTFVSSLLYFSVIFTVIMPGSFINDRHSTFIFGSSLTGGLFMLLVIIYDLTNHNAVLIEIFVFILLFVILVIVSSLILQHKVHREMSFLDFLLENSDNYDPKNNDDKNIDQYQNLSESAFLRYAITGFIHSHAICANWAFFKTGIDKYPDSKIFWLVFAKCVAIYPEEGSLLSYIVHKIQSNSNITGYSTHIIISQAQMIITQRDGTLSLDLKIRLSKAVKQVQLSKRKIRHIWDLAIQSNINEIDQSVANAYVSVNKATTNFNHLLAQYPNNRFVARSYSKFLHEVLGHDDLHKEWTEKVHLLQRGILINSDRAYILGMSSLPMLPKNIHLNSSHYNDSETMSEVVDLDDQFTHSTIEQSYILRNHISNISIPSIKCLRAWFSFLFLLLIFIPSVAMLVYAPQYFETHTIPLDYMYHISYLRATIFLLPLFSQHYLLQNIVDPNNSSRYFFPEPIFVDYEFQSFGQQNQTKQQLKYIVTKTAMSVEELSRFRTFSVINNDTDLVHSIIFDEYIPYYYFTKNNSFHLRKISLQTAVMQYLYLATDLLQSEIDISMLNSINIYEPIYNSPIVVKYVSEALSYFSDFFIESHSSIDNVALFAIMFLCITYAVIIIGLLIYQVDNIRKTKVQIYQCLTALPKNVVSQVAESLNLIEKDENSKSSYDDTNQLNKQEENIIKVFSSASDVSMMGSTEKFIYIFLNIVMLICVLAIIVIIGKLFPDFTNHLKANAPHLDYVLGIVAYMGGALKALETLTYDLIFNGYNQENIDYFSDEMYQRINNFTEYYHLARYGGIKKEIPPYNGYQAAHEKATVAFHCEDPYKIPEDFVGHYKCLSIDVLTNIIEPFFTTILYPVTTKASTKIDNYNPMLINSWIIFIKLTDSLFFPMFKNVVDEMKNLLNESLPLMTTIASILLGICFISTFLIIYESIKTEERMRYALSLLLHCPSEVVMQTSKILDILEGDFVEKPKAGVMHHSDFFDAVVKSIPDSVIVINEKNQVESMNRATERIYGIKYDSFIGSDAEDFFSSAKFSENICTIFDSETKSINVEYKMTDQDVSFLELTILEAKKVTVITTRDQTQNVTYNTLISEEKSKSDKLLSSILPPNLILRVQKGEENISFSVQSATICFMDIVGFTPWCAANTASMIMSTLNLMFRKFDSSLSTHSTLTKIKCIGDCYMAAGGIFVEVNQPAVHAKEMVEFGLEAIMAVLQLNEALNQSLRIRVGVNTGGPIVAGVLGIDKPTFEILGPAINMAQQMEHHGVPMKIHMSRSVYELIYTSGFNVKERGHIEIKNGTVRTYLVQLKGEKK
ncbi:Adenylate and Guanylate cyclase catalytic domain containing protein [Tritrichomonas foetus]|uniref:Adenylate and Guanylate cyclase catalytic domain containing protein n=1 Tax=Tritrichomonas foetus TaxID=1144522 RepID=A0A1J4KAU4_9EUKA|nr:Adenylate and Guanylate cyclase catalytic domain containing protein [Tritrichomonas foetus]|eukprot:OHT08551.1 Adenylate and Guanylate cyclase catalytic domain containing protein [Tritrichomonas foetus]